MSSALHREKLPDLVRCQLLDCAVRLALRLDADVDAAMAQNSRVAAASPAPKTR